MFGLFNKKETQIVFTEELLEQLESVLTEAHNILRDSAYTAQANFLKQILASALNKETERFKSLILSNELLGGAGSVIDCWIEDELQMSRLHELETELFHLLSKTGLNQSALSRLKWWHQVKIISL
jgi:hypothetical protein